MSRITFYDDLDPLDAGRWIANARKVFRSRRGVAMLRELEAALLALPTHRLVKDAFCQRSEEPSEAGDVEESDVCVLGAYALYKGVPLSAMPFEEWDWHGTASEQSEWAVANLGVAYTAAWELINRNDEEFDRLTPEQRYTAFLRWTREQIAFAEASRSAEQATTSVREPLDGGAE